MPPEIETTQLPVAAKESSAKSLCNPNLIEKFKSIKEGSICIFALDSNVNPTYAQLLVEDGWLLNQRIAGMRPHKINGMLTLLTGSNQSKEFAKNVRISTLKTAEQRMTLDISEKRLFSYVSAEGFSAVKTIIANSEETCISLIQSRMPLKNSDEIEALKNFQQIVKEHKKTLLIFSEKINFDVDSQGENAFDYLFEITNCTPDENHATACAVSCSNLQEILGPNNFHRALLQGYWKDDKFFTSSTRYTGDSPVTRSIWAQADAGKSLSELAEEFGKNKSTISRTLAKLPPLKSKIESTQM